MFASIHIYSFLGGGGGGSNFAVANVIFAAF